MYIHVIEAFAKSDVVLNQQMKRGYSPKQMKVYGPHEIIDIILEVVRRLVDLMYIQITLL